MPTLPSSGSQPWSYGPSLIRRTAVCGPACTVVWQGRVGDHSPYADCKNVEERPFNAAQKRTGDAGLQPQWVLSVYFFSVGRKSNAAEFMQ